MKMLNPGFDEGRLGFKRWSDFITAAGKKGFIKISDEETQPIVVPTAGKEKGVLQKGLQGLLKSLEDMDGGGSKNPQFHEYSLVSSKIKDLGVDIRNLGFRQFKKFIQAADIRGIVESKNEGMKHFVRRIV